MARELYKEIILTHSNADFDAVASLLAAHKLYPTATPVLPQLLSRNVSEFITLYKNGLPFIAWHEFKPHGKVERIILVDTQRIPDVRHIKRDTPILIIDHHPYEGDQGAHVTFTGEEIGANATLLTEQIIANGHIQLTSLEATLLMLGIYADTGSLTYSKTTTRDIRAAAWLLEHGAVLDTVRRFMSIPLNEAQRALLDQLINSQQTRYIHGHAITVCTAEIDETLDNINHVTHRIRDLLEPTGLIVLVQMPKRIQAVLRSTTDDVDMGGLARALGGGGHARAAAATIINRKLADIETRIWEELPQFIQPMTTIADLMSYGVQTVNANQKIIDIIGHLRRIGHEGYPVLDNGRVVGLLTRRDADRAIEHGLKESTARDVMLGGAVMLAPDASVSMLEQTMVDANWGQIPVVTSDQRLIGIVTRTDLIKHWAKIHPASQPRYDHISTEALTEALGEHLARFIGIITNHAQADNINLYIVGGIVRDMLLKRPNDDIDFVTETPAIEFAEALAMQYGGDLNSFRPFGTAKWILSEEVAQKMGIAYEALPPHIDFATARNEFYQHPTALPSVYSGSIKLDLHRRDFTINTMAIQLSPQSHAHRILDFYGGLNDLNNKIIRALHSLSFVDDPTRILRAVRFEKRLGFMIEDRTIELINTHREMLRRITGERVRNELTLLLQEYMPERGISALSERGLLHAIHPDLTFPDGANADFMTIRHQKTTDWCARVAFPIADYWRDTPELVYWHVWMKHLTPQTIIAICERLRFGQKLMGQFQATATLFQQADGLLDKESPPSKLTYIFDEMSELGLLALWVNGEALVKHRIEAYLTIWRYVQSSINGDTLQTMGIPTGKHYRVILEKLRSAKLDGITHSDQDERNYLEMLLNNMEMR